MRAIRKRPRLALFFGIGAVVALVAAGAAYALTAKSFRYSSPKTGYVRVSHMAFAPDGPGFDYHNNWTGGLSSTGDGCLNAGVELPAGAARVKAVTFYFESGPASNFYGELRRRQLATGGNQAFSAFPSNNAGTLTSVTVAVPGVRQPVTAGRAYGLGVCPGTDGTFFGARIRYTYTSAGS